MFVELFAWMECGGIVWQPNLHIYLNLVLFDTVCFSSDYSCLASP